MPNGAGCVSHGHHGIGHVSPIWIGDADALLHSAKQSLVHA
jgi:hypothetical protein